VIEFPIFKLELRVVVNISSPRGKFSYHRVLPSKILHVSHTAFICIVWISEQIATFVLHNINRLIWYSRGGECLLRGRHRVLMETGAFSLEKNVNAYYIGFLIQS
jgi:hypothetical protein